MRANLLVDVSRGVVTGITEGPWAEMTFYTV